MSRRRRGSPRTEHSAGGVVLRQIEGSIHVLVIQDPYGKWGLPKGHLEDGEESVDAAVREVVEETSLVAEAGPLISTIDWYFRADGRLVHKFCDFFLMSSPTGDPVPQASEGITDCVWLRWDDALERIDYDNAMEVVASARRLLQESDTGLRFAP